MGDAEEMEEERRLCYVAMTRAKETLVLTNARQRMLSYRTAPAMPSRFLKEIPEENMEWLSAAATQHREQLGQRRLGRRRRRQPEQPVRRIR